MLVVVGTAAVGYLIYAPWVYAFPLTGEGHARRRWLSRWD
jgi:dolichyl-phosphate-mannose--protein O-mannosyl transferase